MMSSYFLQDLLNTVDEIQVAAMVGHLDAEGIEALNVLTDIQHTLAEAISELEYRLNRSRVLN